MMKQIIRKFRSRAGESLVESLIAILIFTLASIVMYTMVTTAADINMSAKEADRNIQAQLVVAEQAETSPSAGTVIFSLVEGDTTTQIMEVDVNIYGNTKDALYSYFADSAEATEETTP